MIQKISEFIAKFLSVLLHPILLPFWAYCIVLMHDDTDLFQIPFNSRWLIGGMVFVVSAAFPALLIVLLRQLKVISSFSMQQKEERVAPILISAVFFYLSYYLLNALHIAPIFAYYMLGATMLAIISLFVSVWYKMSLHLIGMGGLTAAFIGISLLVGDHYLSTIIILILFSGLLAFSRLKLKAHQPSEIYSGFALGFILMYSLMAFVH